MCELDENMTCTGCGHSHPDEVAQAWGLPDLGPLCADCWCFVTEVHDALDRGDWDAVTNLMAGLSAVCL